MEDPASSQESSNYFTPDHSINKNESFLKKLTNVIDSENTDECANLAYITADNVSKYDTLIDILREQHDVDHNLDNIYQSLVENSLHTDFKKHSLDTTTEEISDESSVKASESDSDEIITISDESFNSLLVEVQEEPILVKTEQGKIQHPQNYLNSMSEKEVLPYEESLDKSLETYKTEKGVLSFSDKDIKKNCSFKIEENVQKLMNINRSDDRSLIKAETSYFFEEIPLDEKSLDKSFETCKIREPETLFHSQEYKEKISSGKTEQNTSKILYQMNQSDDSIVSVLHDIQSKSNNGIEEEKDNCNLSPENSASDSESFEDSSREENNHFSESGTFLNANNCSLIPENLGTRNNVNNSFDFNDTLEEMELALRQGLNYVFPENLRPQTPTDEVSLAQKISKLPTSSKKRQLNDKFNYVQSPVAEYIKQNQENFKLPLKPVKGKTTPNHRTPLSQQKIFKNVISPIGIYINSPSLVTKKNVITKTIPMLKSPAKIESVSGNKENNFVLPEVVYKPAKKVIALDKKDIFLPSSLRKMVPESVITEHEVRIRKDTSMGRKLLEEDLTVVESSLLNHSSEDTSFVNIKNAYIK